MNTQVPNYSLREDLIAYWSEHAKTFDQSIGHAIATGEEEQAWSRLIGDAIGSAPRSILELACGMGEISQLLLGLGYAVTALDFAKPMPERARSCLNIQLRLGDAEHCMEPDASFVYLSAKRPQ